MQSFRGLVGVIFEVNGKNWQFITVLQSKPHIDVVMLRIRCLCAMHPWYFCDHACTSLKTQRVIWTCVQVRTDWVIVCSAGGRFLKLMTETPETVPRIKTVNICFMYQMEGTTLSIACFESLKFESIIHFDKILTKIWLS